jgi:hypothetical protein
MSCNVVENHWSFATNIKNINKNGLDFEEDVNGKAKTMVVVILHQLRFLSLGGVEEKKASDFIGSHVGESEKKTQAILKSAEGKVLLIDEAYGLDDDVYGKKVWRCFNSKLA